MCGNSQLWIRKAQNYESSQNRNTPSLYLCKIVCHPNWMVDVRRSFRIFSFLLSMFYCREVCRAHYFSNLRHFVSICWGRHFFSFFLNVSIQPLKGWIFTEVKQKQKYWLNYGFNIRITIFGTGNMTTKRERSFIKKMSKRRYFEEIFELTA